MARCISFSDRVVITDIEVRTPEGTFRGSAMRGNFSYSSFSDIVLSGDNIPDEGSPLHRYVEACIKAEAQYTYAEFEAQEELLRAHTAAHAAYLNLLSSESRPSASDPAPSTLLS